MNKFLAEFFGTFWLVLGGCGTAVLAGGAVGFSGVALAFGLTVLTGIYAFGHISGAHFNPAVSFGLWAGGRFQGKSLIPYIISQILGAVLAAGVLYLIVSSSGMEIGNFAANGYGENSPGGYSMTAALITEFVMTFMFVIVIMGATDHRAPRGFAGIAIGLALTLIHLISIPVTNTSVNPARSISQAIFAQGTYLSQLWLFILIPIVGGICAGLVYRVFAKEEIEESKS